MNTPLLLDRDGAIATLTLNRPASLNALDSEMIDALITHSAALAADDSVRCVIIKGAGRHFMAGGDIRAFGDQLAGAPSDRRHHFTRMVEHMHSAIENLQRMPHPVLASVHGAVAGFGLSLMCVCDLAIASESSLFHLGVSSPPRLTRMRRVVHLPHLSQQLDSEAIARSQTHISESRNPPPHMHAGEHRGACAAGFRWPSAYARPSA